MSTYWDQREARIKETMPKVDAAVRNGASPTEAINKICSDNDSYNAALAKYGLKPHLHD